jgi:methylmalonyl-CoA/ethylmalonyl-CoA epimerase
LGRIPTSKHTVDLLVYNPEFFLSRRTTIVVQIKRIDHIAIVVDNIESALGFWRDALGLELDHLQDVPEQNSKIAFLPVQDTEIELVMPTTTDSGISRYLEKRGPGMHHVCLEVEDIDMALQHLRSKGIRLINDSPQPGSGGKKYAFIHPESTYGVLVELYQLPRLD